MLMRVPYSVCVILAALGLARLTAADLEPALCCEFVTVVADETMAEGSEVFNGINATGLYRLERDSEPSGLSCAGQLPAGAVYYTKVVADAAYPFDIYFNGNISRWLLDHDGSCSFSLDVDDDGEIPGLPIHQYMAGSAVTTAGGCPSDPALSQGWTVNITSFLSIPAAIQPKQWPSFDVSCAVASATPTPPPQNSGN